MAAENLIKELNEMGWTFQLIAEVPLAGSTASGWRASVRRRLSNGFLVHEWAEHEKLAIALESVRFNCQQDRNRPGTDVWVQVRGKDVSWATKGKINIDVELSHYILRRKNLGHVGFENF